MVNLIAVTGDGASPVSRSTLTLGLRQYSELVVFSFIAQLLKNLMHNYMSQPAAVEAIYRSHYVNDYLYIHERGPF